MGHKHLHFDLRPIHGRGWVESAYLFIEIKEVPAVASIFVRQFLSNLVTRPCHCFLVVAGGLVTKTKGCGICSFGGHETLENMVCHSCGDPVSFLVAEAISDFDCKRCTHL